MKWKESASRMWGVNSLLALVALLAGWGAAAAASRYLDNHVQQLKAQAQLQYTPRPVVVAKHDLEAGTALTAELMSLRQMPSGYLPSGTVDSASAASIIGRRLSVALRRGDPLTETVLGPGAVPSLAAALPAGQRALTVAVDEVNSLSGLLVPGDRVDLYMARGQGESGARLTLLMEQVQVVATGNQLRASALAQDDLPASDYSTVTLLVDAEQAGKIILAQRTGSLSVALRPAGDEGRSRLLTRNSRRLLELEPGPLRVRNVQDDRIELLLGGYGGTTPRRELLTPGVLRAQAGDRS